MPTKRMQAVKITRVGLLPKLVLYLLWLFVPRCWWGPSQASSSNSHPEALERQECAQELGECFYSSSVQDAEQHFGCTKTLDCSASLLAGLEPA